VEGQMHPIRYSPLQFDGWKQTHWTKPFSGERYSLVWYTPQGLDKASEALDAGQGWPEVQELVAALPPLVPPNELPRFAQRRFEQTTGPITTQEFSMVPPSVNFRSRFTRLAITRLQEVANATNLLLPAPTPTNEGPLGFQGRVLFDSDASPEQFALLEEGVESVRAVLLHRDLDSTLGAPEIAEWLVQEIDWPGALQKWERFGNRPPGGDKEFGVHVRCKRSLGRIPPGTVQDLRLALARKLWSEFGWEPKVQRSEACFEVQLAFNSDGVLVEAPLLVQRNARLEPKSPL